MAGSLKHLERLVLRPVYPLSYPPFRGRRRVRIRTIGVPMAMETPCPEDLPKGTEKSNVKTRPHGARESLGAEGSLNRFRTRTWSPPRCRCNRYRLPDPDYKVPDMCFCGPTGRYRLHSRHPVRSSSASRFSLLAHRAGVIGVLWHRERTVPPGPSS